MVNELSQRGLMVSFLALAFFSLYSIVSTKISTLSRVFDISLTLTATTTRQNIITAARTVIIAIKHRSTNICQSPYSGIHSLLSMNGFKQMGEIASDGNLLPSQCTTIHLLGVIRAINPILFFQFITSPRTVIGLQSNSLRPRSLSLTRCPIVNDMVLNSFDIVRSVDADCFYRSTSTLHYSFSCLAAEC